VLVDHEIRDALASGDITVSPDDGVYSRIQPASLDVRLGGQFLTLDRNAAALIDPKFDSSSLWNGHGFASDLEEFVIHPNELVLATTLEAVGLADTVLARVEGKSSLGRLGILVHATAGYIDPGWTQAPITLEISTVVGVPVKLYPGMPIAQLAFDRVSPVATSYSGKYVGQSGPTPSQYHRNWMGSSWV
jgi:dCTP deaminase